MRVVAGANKGRVLRAPRGDWLRPTSDRVREAIFDMLASMMDLEDASVVDLFAGTGAMGIEAMSRGASPVVFVDQEPLALDAVRANLRSIGLEGPSAKVVRAEVVSWLSRRHVRRGDTPSRTSGTFDLALVDPPYAFSDWQKLLGHLDAEVAVLESDRPLEPPEEFDVVKSKRYGSTLVTLVRAHGTTLG